MSPSLTKAVTALFLSLNSPFAFSFSPFAPLSMRHKTALHIDQGIAEMIDNEFYRQNHIEEYHQRQTKRDTEILKEHVPEEFSFGEIPFLVDDEDIIAMRKDKLLADKDPEKYCADRCIATGNCEVFEDFFELSPKQVVKFCEECVLSDEEESCDLPESVLDKYITGGSLRP